MHRCWFVLGVLVLVGCGDDSEPSLDSGMADASTPDTAVPDAPVEDSGLDAPTLDAPSVDAPSSDTGPRPTEGHTSYIPPGLTPELATRLIVLGDSISAGSGAGGRSLIYHSLLVDNDEGRWPDDGGTDLFALTGGMVEVIDHSAGGATTANLRPQASNAVDDLTLPAEGHTIVVATVGGNDLQSAILGGNPTGPLLDRAMEAIRAAVEEFSDPADFPDGVSIYVAAVYDPSDGEAQIDGCFFNLELPELVAALDVWRDRYIALGTEMGFSVVDALGHFHGHGHNFENTDNPFYDPDDPSGWFNDCIHPNTRGHHELRRLFFEAMNPDYTAD